MCNIILLSARRKSRDPTSDIGAIVRELAAQIVSDDTDAAVVEWAAEKFGRAHQDVETARRLRFALRVVVAACVKQSLLAECSERGFSPPGANLTETLAADVAELTAAPLANRVICRLTAGGPRAR